LVANGFFEMIVHNVFHINCIKVIGPRMKNLEALMLNALISVSLDIVEQEFESCLVCLDRIAQVVFVDALLVVPKETSNSLDA
jgi:hypothetical protein